MQSRLGSKLPFGRLALLALGGLVVHGYHLGVEDGEIYAPAAKKALHPELYPFASDLFLAQTHLSIFAPLVGWSARLTHLPMDWTLLVWYLLGLMLLMVTGWMLAAECFENARARWTAVATLAAVLSMPAANTALLLIDPYLTARSFTTPLSLLALLLALRGRFGWASLLALFIACLHPLMAAYLFFLYLVLWLAGQSGKTQVRTALPAVALLVLPAGFNLEPATGAYRESIYSRDYFFLYNWTWYHWLGLLGPLAFLLWFSRASLRATRPAFQRLSQALIPFGLVSIAAGAVLCLTPRLEMFLRLQPLRCFHLITLVFILLLAGVVGEYAAAKRAWAVAVGVSALAVGMFAASQATYPFSPQIELPSATSPNPWVNALLWIRANTPTGAVFAVDSHYFKEDPVDVHGFRAIAERSDLADYYKDGGVVSLIPAIAPEWKQMSDATTGLNKFGVEQFRSLKKRYPVVEWTVIHGPRPAGMDCPYDRQGYVVCRMP